MQEPTMRGVTSEVVKLPQRRPRSRRRRPGPSAETPPRARGRAWINGREVGGTDPRFEHLAQRYD